MTLWFVIVNVLYRIICMFTQLGIAHIIHLHVHIVIYHPLKYLELVLGSPWEALEIIFQYSVRTLIVAVLRTNLFVCVTLWLDVSGSGHTNQVCPLVHVFDHFLTCQVNSWQYSNMDHLTKNWIYYVWTACVNMSQTWNIFAHIFTLM